MNLSEDGLRIHIDVKSVFEAGTGTVDLHFRLSLDASVLARLPATSCAVSLSDSVPVLIRRWA